MAEKKGLIVYSVIIPVYNESANILPLYHELKIVMDGLKKSYEMIFIDDGSTDSSFNAIRELHNRDKNVRAIRFRRNFGQTAAICAGFHDARGKIIITIDGDLQNNPHDIPRLLQKIEKGYDVVSGWRFDRKDPKFGKRLPSKLSNRLARRFTGLNLHDFGCTLKAYRREAVEDIELYGEMHRYIPAIVAWRGYSISEVVVDHRSRQRGRTKYGTERLLRGFLDLLNIKFWSDYSTRPLHFFGRTGIISFLIGLLIGLYKLIMRFMFDDPLEAGPMLIFAVMLIILGVQLIMFGFLGEIMVRMYYQGKRKTYHIREILGGNDEDIHDSP